MRIFLVGDIHGDPNIVSSSNWDKAKDLTEKDLVIFLGDFGLYWGNTPSKEEEYWLDWLARKPYQVAFVDGNHENFDLINSFPESTKWGGKVGIDHRVGGDIIHLKRGEVFNINNKKIFVMGGASSIDKMHRTEGISWWPQEQHSKAEEENALNNLDSVNWKVDYVLTHTCPDSVIKEFVDNPYSEKFNDPVSKFLEFIDNRLTYDLWCFGHFHNDRRYVNNDKYQCHYKTIQELPID